MSEDKPEFFKLKTRALIETIEESLDVRLDEIVEESSFLSRFVQILGIKNSPEKDYAKGFQNYLQEFPNDLYENLLEFNCRAYIQNCTEKQVKERNFITDIGHEKGIETPYLNDWIKTRFKSNEEKTLDLEVYGLLIKYEHLFEETLLDYQKRFSHDIYEKCTFLEKENNELTKRLEVVSGQLYTSSQENEALRDELVGLYPSAEELEKKDTEETE